MNAQLAKLKGDLLSRHFLPIFALAALALVGAIAYVVLGGGSSSSTPSASISTSLPPVPPVIAAPAPANPNQAVAETTDGSTYQHAGATHDPFIPLPQPKKTTGVNTTAGSVSSSSAGTTSSGGKSTGGSSTGTTGSGSKGASGSGSSGSTGGNGSGSSGSGNTGGGTSTGNHGSEGATHQKSAKPKPTYRVAIQFGTAPPPGQAAQLIPYTGLSRVTPLPSKSEQLIAFAGVASNGKSAQFSLLQPAILKGNGVCLPSTAQCESVDLPTGQTEELSFVNAANQTVVYLLQVVSIEKGADSAHEARAAVIDGRGARLVGLRPPRHPLTAISYGRHGASSHHGRRVARSRPYLHR